MMQTTTLRKVGGSVMLAVPPALLEVLNLSPGAEVGITIVDGELRVQPIRKKKYTLTELLGQCDYSDGPSDEDRAWDRLPPHGRELL